MKIPEGRNASIELIDIRLEFLRNSRDRFQSVIEILEEGHKKRAAMAIEPISIQSNRVYEIWCKILARSSELMKKDCSPGSSIDEIEIMLFSMAPTVCVLKLANALLGQLSNSELRCSDAA